jgi:hypothetical protein
LTITPSLQTPLHLVVSLLDTCFPCSDYKYVVFKIIQSCKSPSFDGLRALSDDDSEQLPRATSSATRSANLLRTPLGSSFIRKYSDDADKKVRGPVIGIDLGMLYPFPLDENFDGMLTSFFHRNHQFCSSYHGRYGCEDN